MAGPRIDPKTISHNFRKIFIPKYIHCTYGGVWVYENVRGEELLDSREMIRLWKTEATFGPKVRGDYDSVYF